MNLLNWERCQRCRECCHWVNPEELIILFTEDDVARVRQLNEAALPVFHPYKGAQNLFFPEVVLSPDPKIGGQCPFWNAETGGCEIYDIRPMDCRIWPFLYARDRHGAVNIACFKSNWCPVLRESPEEVLQGYYRRMVDRLSSEAMLAWLRRYPGMVLDEDESHLNLVMDISDLL